MTDADPPAAGRPPAPLWRTDGARYGRCDVAATHQGGLEITHHDMGASDRAAWGGDDNELSLTLTPAAAADLAIALVRDRFGGQADALRAIAAYCQAHDVEAALRPWT